MKIRPQTNSQRCVSLCPPVVGLILALRVSLGCFYCVGEVPVLLKRDVTELNNLLCLY